jgi:hypothetical protein
VADGTKLPFADESLGAIYIKAAPFASFSDIRSNEEFIELNAKAKREYATYRPGTGKAPANQRIGMIEEANRTLRPDGLLIMEDAVPGDEHVAELNGLQLCAWLEYKKADDSYSFVFKKLKPPDMKRRHQSLD